MKIKVGDQPEYDAAEVANRGKPIGSPRVQKAFDAVHKFVGKAMAVLFGLAVGALTLYGVWNIWPSGIGDIPLSALTLKHLLALFTSLGVGFFGLGIAWAIVAAAVEE
jgi:hypothetical protein